MNTNRSRTSLLIIFLTVFLDLVGFSIIFPLFPEMLDHYLAAETVSPILKNLVAGLNQFAHVSSSSEDVSVYVTVLFGGVLGALYALLQFLCSPFWGRLSDRIGRRPVLLITTLGLAGSYLAWFFAEAFSVLVLARLIGGVMGGNISVASAAVADITDEKSRAKGMGMLGAAFGLGFILGPAIGATLYHLHPTPLARPYTHPFSVAALGAAVLSLMNFIWVYRRFEETYHPSNGPSKAIKRTINPFGGLTQLGIASVTRLCLIYLLFSLAFSGMEFTLTFLVKERYAYSPKHNALLFLFIGLIIALTQGGIVRRLAPKIGEKKMGLIGFIALFTGLIGIAFIKNQGLFYFFLGIMSFGSALVNPALSALVSLRTPNDRQGESLGIFRSMGSLARAVGPIGACVLYWKMGAEAPYWLAGLMMLPPAYLLFKTE